MEWNQLKAMGRTVVEIILNLIGVMENQCQSGYVGLALRFPSLCNAEGIMPWNPLRLDSWALSIGRDRQALHAARFILDRWNSQLDWECGRFDMHSAINCWDLAHRFTFLDLAAANSHYSA